MTECPLCLSVDVRLPVRGADHRAYFLCPRCSLIAADSRHHVSREEETAHYLTHENGIQHAGYVRFLNRVIEPALRYLKPPMRGLDYGCGPGPTLSRLLRRQGLACDDYDPIFVDVPLDPPYDFVFATECLEHFCRPARDIGRIAGLLRPGGIVGIMTELWSSPQAFGTWYYTRDPTHVSFYHRRTFEYVCAEFRFEPLWSDGKRVIILRRTAF